LEIMFGIVFTKFAVCFIDEISYFPLSCWRLSPTEI